MQKFDSSGNFVLMFGGDVNKTKAEEGKPEAERNLCTAASGDVCQAGTIGAGDGQFGVWPDTGTFIAAGPTLGPTDTIYVGDVGRVQTFDTSGNYLGDFPDPQGILAGRTVSSLALDPSDDLYVAFSELKVLKLDASGAKECEFPVQNLFFQPLPLATDPEGNVYVLEGGPIYDVRNEVVEYDSNCAPLTQSGFAVTPPGVFSTALATNVSCPGGDEPGDLYVANISPGTAAYIDAYGPPPICFEPPPPVPPTISGQFASEVNVDGAVVKAKINPRFWADTRYYVEYGTGKCSEGGCTATQPGPPGALLTSQVLSKTLTTSGVFLAGLAAETTYHFRFVAQSSGGGPVTGGEGTFTTAPAPAPAKSDCPNQAFRTGPGAYLPDCRAYEMVTPLEKGNGDILPLSLRDGFPSGLEQASLSGEGLSYATYRAFGDSDSSPYSSEYLARRDPAAGWSSAGLNPPREGISYLAGTQFDLPFKAFSADLSSAWLLQDTAPVLEAGTAGGFTNLYRRDNSSGDYEALIDSTPANLGDWTFTPEVQGFSADGNCTVFRANDKLATASAAPPAGALGNVFQLYERCGEQTRLVSVLPSGTASTIGSSAGTANDELYIDRNSSVLGAVSTDGQRIYWTASSGIRATGPGALHLRINAAQPQSKVSAGKCTEPTKACTLLLSAGPAQFWQGSPEGSKALYSVGEKLFLFDFESAASTEVIGKAKGVVGASTDLSRIYAVSEEAFDGAEASKPNLYLIEGATKRLVGALTNHDLTGTDYSPAAKSASRHLARVSTDGGHAVFMSTAPLTGYDNTDQNSGEADAEVFLYDAAAEQLICASCNPTGQAPAGRELPFDGHNSNLWAAGRIPVFKTQLYAPRILAEDGSRLFFESFEALLPADTNGRLDVYQWERAASKAQCTEELGGLYLQASGGCLSLISSGKSAEDSEFVDADPSGEDVFIRTGESLLPQDPGLIDIYDARIEGGFPPPPAPQPGCEGQACQNPPPAPQDSTPASESFQGPGNVKEGAKPRKCPKGKHRVKRKGKAICVKNKAKHKSKGAKSGRAGR